MSGKRFYSSYNEILELAYRKPLICTTIFAKDKNEFVQFSRQALRSGSDLAELRIDFLKHPSPSSIHEIISESSLPLIATSRTHADGGFFSPSEERARISLLESAIRSRPSFVDVEFNNSIRIKSKLIRLARNSEVGVICSHHDFAGTPRLGSIMKLYGKIQREDPDIAKLVFSPKSRIDLMNIVIAAERISNSSDHFAVFGMGELGKITRMITPMLGSCLTYCSLRETRGGIGQISVRRARVFFALIHRKNGWKRLEKDRKKFLRRALEELSVERPTRLGPSLISRLLA